MFDVSTASARLHRHIRDEQVLPRVQVSPLKVFLPLPSFDKNEGFLNRVFPRGKNLNRPRIYIEWYIRRERDVTPESIIFARLKFNYVEDKGGGGQQRPETN